MLPIKATLKHGHVFNRDRDVRQSDEEIAVEGLGEFAREFKHGLAYANERTQLNSRDPSFFPELALRRLLVRFAFFNTASGRNPRDCGREASGRLKNVSVF